MNIVKIPNNLPDHLKAYAVGDTNLYPNTVGVKRKTIVEMKNLRRLFVRNILLQKPEEAYELPDFNELMSEEISRYAKKELQPVLFAGFDSFVCKAPKFRYIFNRTIARLYREYEEATEAGRPYIKHKYLSINAKRQAFGQAIQDPYILGELELVCFGKTRYGLM